MNRSVVTFGELLMRLSPPGHLRLRQAHSLDLIYGGAEANVAIALANWAIPVQYVTRLPDNELGAACLQTLRGQGVSCDFIELGGERLGLYFLEVGAGNRPSRVIYDRAGSSFASVAADAFDWPGAFAGAGWFHWSGISPAVSSAAAQATTRAIAAAREAGLIISCDLNYRHSLWQWGLSPATLMPGLVEQCHVLAANTAGLVLGLPDLPPGETPDEAAEACAQLAGRYPNLKQITMTCRQDGSAAEQRLTAVMWQAGQVYTSPTFTLTNIVDRVGAGDAFMAGLIYGLLTYPQDPRRVVAFAAASAALKHTIAGDANQVTVDEVDGLLGPQGFDIIR